jgi:hypothetical protein
LKATTLEEFRGMGVNTESKEFLAGMKYGRNCKADKFRACAGFIRYWAGMNGQKARVIGEAA